MSKCPALLFTLPTPPHPSPPHPTPPHPSLSSTPGSRTWTRAGAAWVGTPRWALACCPRLRAALGAWLEAVEAAGQPGSWLITRDGTLLAEEEHWQLRPVEVACAELCTPAGTAASMRRTPSWRCRRPAPAPVAAAAACGRRAAACCASCTWAA